MPRQTIPVLTFALLLAGSLCANARAQDLASEIDRLSTKVPEVIVTAERPYQPPLDYGAGRYVIGPREIEESGQETIEEVLRRRPSIYVHFESESGGKPNIGMRGLNPERSIDLAMLVDGIPLAPAPYGHPGYSLFPFTLERVRAIDVLRGGYAIRYGPNNIAGVINFLSNPIPAAPRFEEHVRLGTPSLVTNYTSVGGTFGDVGILIESVLKRGHGDRDHSHFEVQNHGAKVNWQVADRLSILFQLDDYEERTQLPGGLSVAAYETDPDQTQVGENSFDGDQLRGNVRVNFDISDDQHLEVLAYAFQGDRTFFLGRPVQYGDMPSVMRATPRPMKVWAIQPMYRARVEFLGTSHEYEVGVRFQQERIDDQRFQWNWPDGERTFNRNKHFQYDAWSAFLTDTFRPIENLELTPGVRFEMVDLDGQDRQAGTPEVHRDYDEVLPGLTAVYFVRDDWSVFGNVQRSFKATDRSTIELSDKPQDVNAERAWGYDLGTRFTPFERALYVEATLFWIDLTDRLQQDPTNADVYMNIGKQRNRGVELYAEADLGKVNGNFEGFHVYAGYTYLDAEIRSGEFAGNDARQAPSGRASWGASYHHPCGVWAALDGNWTGEAYADEANTREPTADGMLGLMPAYALWNVRVGYDADFEDGRGHLGIQIGSNNVLDEDSFYRRPEQGIIPGPGRNYYVSFDFGWEF